MRNRTLPILILVLIILALGSLCYTQWRSARTNREVVNSNMVHMRDSLKITRDLYNTEHVSRKDIEGKYEDLYASYKVDMDSAAKRVGISTKQIRQLTKENIDLKGKFTAPVVHSGDTTRVQYVDSFTHWYETRIHDTAHVQYEVEVPIEIVQHWNRNWFLGAKTNYINGWSPNPNAHITGLSNIEIQNTKPKIPKGVIFAMGAIAGMLLLGLVK